MQSLVHNPILTYLLACSIFALVLPIAIISLSFRWAMQGYSRDSAMQTTKHLTSTTSGGLGWVGVLLSIPLFGYQLTLFWLLGGFIAVTIMAWTGTWIAMRRMEKRSSLSHHH